MRRLASAVFASRRNDKSDPHPPTTHPGLARKTSRVFPSLSRKYLPPSDPPPLIPSDFVNSSSSSSSGSTTIRTPDDDGLPRTPSKKGSWKTWLGGRNAPVSDHPEVHLPPAPWQSDRNAVRTSNPGSNETDDASLQSDDPYGNPDDPLASSPQMHSSRANTRTMIMNSLVHEPTSHPLFLSPGATSFPRSCHISRSLRRRETLESELHKKSLLVRLDRLSPSEESSIAPLASKPVPAKPHTSTHHKFQEDIFPSADAVSLHSNSLENWVSRPCFEDRLLLWTRSDSGEIIRTRIPGSHFGVAALEFSESLELLAGTLPENDSDSDVEPDTAFVSALDFTLPSLVLDLDTLATPAKELLSEPLSRASGPSQSKDSPARLSPSAQPDSVSLAMSNSLSLVRQHSESEASGSASASDPLPKRGVRFADDDGKDDQIPLGYVLRIRKNKEQKAQFLREERERRQRTAQLSTEKRQPSAPPRENRAPRVVVPRQPPRPLVSLREPSKPRSPPKQQLAPVSQAVREEERLRREIEKIEMEKLRKSRELARKQGEERTYAEELQATRARREASRAGRPLESASFSPRVSDQDRSASRDSMYASPRRSSVSHKHTPELVFTPVSPYDGSPSSSLPATPGSQYSFSRPPSVYSAHTASSEDVRGRDNKYFSRRMSVVSDSAKGMSLPLPYDPRASFVPYAWMNTPSVPVIPPVPSMPTIPMVNGMPFYGMDMPLLPPTAPFMMNQLGNRPRSYNGISGQQSPLQSSTSLPRNDGSERVSPSSRNSSPHSSGSHQRRSSDDAARMARASGDPRSGNYNVRGSKMTTSASMRGLPSQGSPQRSSWVPPEQRSSTLRPVSTTYSSGAPTHARRRTAVS